MPRVHNPNVLVGFETCDDAGVYLLTPEIALVQTVDFFTPIVDDPYTFGAIAAANALSDVYAMGGTPLTALSVLAYPGKGDIDDLAEVLRGGADKMNAAGCAVIGGHSVNDEEIKFGYAVTGIVHPDRIWKNSGALPGDVLFLTKRIGTGVISTALKRGLASDEHIQAAIDSMLMLNRRASEALKSLAVHACTDITGFGLMGHGREVAIASDVTLEIEPESVRFLDGALEYSAAGAQPGGLRNNREFAGECVLGEREFAPEMEALLYDPQTSGGLLVSVAAADSAAFEREYVSACRIGRVTERREKPIHLK